ncbi:2-C-methyl-D-erythritol 4-phosphate cytidylyltransferase [Carboxylicivirga linearis]|uniref:2-C-methyl-D-erythritol 4-phosphate cytidylyltransferase n=1 Tax=Carboxylicivirga linearis TaxID=1628157 RepID=A0ABS5JQ17_9BACT|nr:2-C-methyl-D-erythritol 4-phosphate cytidylyltransferase [Carboxylicivirga linearis]MBS2096967.1 2-C-methyl-D-erythritol 4-phosphate cytidylyltransferase [Carboxylicivirga linearis]
MLRYAIIVAGGSGTRMGSEIPKQFLKINGLPVLMHTINTFFDFDNQIKIVLVLPTNQVDYWRELCSTYKFQIKHHITTGGNTRFESVKNGLQIVDTPSLIAIHDGVRPFVSPDTLKRCYHHAEVLGNAIPVLDAFESVRQVDEEKSRALDRSTIKLVQTPQVFKSELLINAYSQDFSPLFTDDASVVETYGETIHLVAGNRENIKITTPSDMVLGEAFIKSGYKDYSDDNDNLLS